jgi:hypothetical protein
LGFTDPSGWLGKMFKLWIGTTVWPELGAVVLEADWVKWLLSVADVSVSLVQMSVCVCVYLYLLLFDIQGDRACYGANCAVLLTVFFFFF